MTSSCPALSLAGCPPELKQAYPIWQAAHPQAQTIRFGELKERLKVTIRTSESAEEYARFPKSKKDAASSRCPSRLTQGKAVQSIPSTVPKWNARASHGNGLEIRSLYVEVKGQMTQADSEKILAFYKAGLADGLPAISDTPVLVLGDIPPGPLLIPMCGLSLSSVP